MKKTFFSIVTMVLVLVGTSTFAQNLKIGYVDSQAVLEKLDEVKAANTQLREFASVKDKELQRENDAFKQKYDQAMQEAQKGTMSDALKAATEKELQALQEKIEIKRQTAQTEISNKEKQLFEPIQKRIQEAIKQIATDAGYTYVLDKQVLFHFPAGDDLSDEVVKKLQASKPQAATTPVPPKAPAPKTPAPTAPKK